MVPLKKDASRLKKIIKNRARGLIRTGYMDVMAPFSSNRVLPHFLIVGAMKSGTTSLFHYLTQHPGILSPRVKEIHFLDMPKNFRRGEGWYRAHFPTHKYMDELSQRIGYQALCGEATPAMISGVYAPNAASIVPTAKIMMILRNPVDRAYSHYHHQRRKWPRERLSFSEALEMEEVRISSELALNVTDPEKIGLDLWRYSYVERGKYIEQINQWLKYYPREQIKILNFEQLKTHSQELCRTVCQFLNLPEYRFETQNRRNIGDYSDSMEHSCRDYLQDIYRPYNRRLFEFLGEDWGWPS